MIFAREISDPLTGLVKKIDETTTANKDKKMGSFVVFLNDDESLEKKLKEMAEKQGLKDLILSIDNVAGPKGYNISKDADVTVILYTKKKVVSNFAFRKGEMKNEDIDKIVADIPNILPK